VRSLDMTGFLSSRTGEIFTKKNLKTVMKKNPIALEASSFFLDSNRTL
jgi:hypothetical protein